MDLLRTRSHSVIKPIPHTFSQFGASNMGNIYKKNLDDTWETFAIGASIDSKCTILVQDDDIGVTSQLIPRTYRIADLVLGTFIPERFNLCHAVKQVNSEGLVLYNLVDDNWHISDYSPTTFNNTVSNLQSNSQLLYQAHDKLMKLTKRVKRFEEGFNKYSKELQQISYTEDLEDCAVRCLDMLLDMKAQLRNYSKYKEPIADAILCLQSGLALARQDGNACEEVRKICNFSNYTVNYQGVVQDDKGNYVSRMIDPETQQIYIPILSATKDGKPYAYIRYSLDLIMMETFHDTYEADCVAEIFHRDGDKDNFEADNLVLYEQLKKEYEYAKEKHNNKQLYRITRSLMENCAYKREILSWELGVLKQKMETTLQPNFIKSCIEYVKASTQFHNNTKED